LRRPNVVANDGQHEAKSKPQHKDWQRTSHDDDQLWQRKRKEQNEVASRVEEEREKEEEYQTCAKAALTSLEEFDFLPASSARYFRSTHTTLPPMIPKENEDIKTSKLQREYDAVMSASAAYMVSLPGTVNTAETPSIMGVKKRGTLEMSVNHLVKTMALLMELKLPPRAVRGSLGSLKRDREEKKEEKKKWKQSNTISSRNWRKEPGFLQINPIVCNDSSSNEWRDCEEHIQEEVSGGRLWNIQDQHRVKKLNCKKTKKRIIEF